MAIAILTALALAFTGYLSWAAISSTGVVGCGGGNVLDCNDVITSRWSRWMGIPVSVMAFAMYLVIFGAIVAGSCSPRWSVRRASWAAVTVFGLTAGLAALWFISLQIIVLKHLCMWCLAAHLCGGLIAGLLIWTRPLGIRKTLLLSLISLTGFAFLPSGQLMFQPATFSVIEHAPAIQSETESIEFAPPEDLDSEVEG